MSKNANTPTDPIADCGDVAGDVHITGRFPVSGFGERAPVRRGKRRRQLGEDAQTTSPERSIAERARALAPTTYLARAAERLLRGSRTRVVFATALALTTACATANDPGTTLASRSVTTGASDAHASHVNESLTPRQREAVARVKDATARYHTLATAIADGFTDQYPAGCAASPAGAQGVHYLNPSRVDTIIELLKPELVMYEPQSDGSMKLVGVDYVVPLAAWTHAEPPTLLGVPFMRNQALGVWALHIWNWRSNPSGTFAMWNPRVSCDLTTK